MIIKEKILNMPKEELKELVMNSYSFNHVLNKLGYKSTTYIGKMIRKRITDDNLSTSHFKRRVSGVIWDTPKSEFEKIVTESNSFSDVLRKLNLRVTGGNLRTLKKRIDADDLNIQNIEENRFKNNGFPKRKMTLEEILVKNSPYKSTHNLKLRLIKEGLLENKCAKCKVGPEWQGIPLSLELDHIDGDNRNNEIENLRILCPNCHSQTETFGGKNVIREKKTYHCTNCNKAVFRTSKLCVTCSNIEKAKLVKTNRPPKEELLNLILTKSFKEIGRIHNVSDNSVRKWCKHYNLPASKQGIIEWKTSI